MDRVRQTVPVIDSPSVDVNALILYLNECMPRLRHHFPGPYERAKLWQAIFTLNEHNGIMYDSAPSYAADDQMNGVDTVAATLAHSIGQAVAASLKSTEPLHSATASPRQQHTTAIPATRNTPVNHGQSPTTSHHNMSHNNSSRPPPPKYTMDSTAPMLTALAAVDAKLPTTSSQQSVGNGGALMRLATADSMCSSYKKSEWYTLFRRLTSSRPALGHLRRDGPNDAESDATAAFGAVGASERGDNAPTRHDVSYDECVRNQ